MKAYKDYLIAYVKKQHSFSELDLTVHVATQFERLTNLSLNTVANIENIEYVRNSVGWYSDEMNRYSEYVQDKLMNYIGD